MRFRKPITTKISKCLNKFQLIGELSSHPVHPLVFAHVNYECHSQFPYGTEPYSLPTFFTVITFQAYTLFLVYPHVGVLISLIFIFVRIGVTFVPHIIMAVDMPVQISPVLETMITAFLFAHETRVSLMGYPVLFQPTFKWETLATVCTYVCPGQFELQTFYYTSRSQLFHGLPGGEHLTP